MSRPPSILLIDNHDSIWAGLKLAGAEVVVRSVEALSPAEVYYYPWQGIVIGGRARGIRVGCKRYSRPFSPQI